MRPRPLALFLVLALAAVGVTVVSGQALRLGAPAPDVTGERWVNSVPLTMQGLRGRVVLVEFWTYG